MTNLKINELNVVDSATGEKLISAGVATTTELLNSGATPVGRRDLAMKTGIDEATILKFVNLADLTRVNGIGRQYSELFEAAGVDTVKELRTRNPENLLTSLKEANNKLKISQTLPSTDQVTDFIENAKNLEPMITY